MGAGLVGGSGGVIAIDFEEHKSGGVIGLLHHFEMKDAGLQKTQAGVDKGGGPERFDSLRHHMDVNMHNQHVSVIAEKFSAHKREVGAIR
jgi:hypothetical protein